MEKDTTHYNPRMLIIIPTVLLTLALLMFAPMFDWPGDLWLFGIPMKVGALAFAILFSPLFVLTQVLKHFNVDFSDQPHDVAHMH